MEIVTGSTGEVHVTPIDDAVRNASVGYLDRKIVFDVYDVFAATIVANREIHVSSGYGENQGRIFKIDDGDYDSVPIENGTQGAKRADLIVARYSMDVQTGFEDISLAVIKGELSTTSYIDPSYETGDINSAIVSSTFHDDFPLYRVRLDGIQIVGIDRLFTPAPSGGRLGVLEEAFEAHKNRYNKTNYRTNLASESTVYPSRVDADGQGNINVRPGVEGVLPASHGGTGQNNLKSGAIGLIGALDANGTTPSTNDYYVGSTSNVSGYQRKPLSALWEFIKAKVIDFMGLSGSGVVPVAKGGTGKTSIGNGKVLVGNASGGFEERGIDTAPSSASNNLITSKGVADAMGRAGYGDMMKSTYDPNEDGIIGLAQGGTGTQDGTINGVKLATNSGRYGYMDGNTFKSFRQPTGNASAGDVLVGKTFANASSDALTGTMPNRPAITQRTSLTFASPYFYARFPQGAYLTNASSGYPEVQLLGSDMGDAAQANVLSGKSFTSASGLKLSGSMADYSNSTPTVLPSAGRGTQTININAGYYNKILVDKTQVYDNAYSSGNADGKNAQKAVSWTTPTLLAVALNSGECIVNYDMTNVSSVKITAGSLGTTYGFFPASQSTPFSGTTITSRQVNVTPTNTILAVRSYDLVRVVLTEKADKLR